MRFTWLGTEQVQSLFLILTLIAQLEILDRRPHAEQRLCDQPVQKSFQRHFAFLAFFGHNRLSLLLHSSLKALVR